MNRKLTKFLIEVLTPPARIVGFGVNIMYWCLIGWWYEKRVRVALTTGLLKNVQDQFWFLFAQHRAFIVPNGDIGHLATLDCSVVTVSAEGLVLRFVSWRDDFQVHVAPAHLPGEWHELSSVLNAIQPENVQRRSITLLQDAAQLLRQNFDSIERALSVEEYPRTKVQIIEGDKYDRAVTRQFEVEVNRFLHD